MSDFQKLRDLLLGDEIRSVERVIERVERSKSRTLDVAEVLPDSVRRSYASGELSKALKDPVADCLGEIVRDEPEKLSDALFPVMGPAIRKSILQALKDLSEQINSAIESSLTPRGIGWRIGAARAGVPFGEYVLRKSFVYRVEQAFLIERPSGRLIEHVSQPTASQKDEDAVSAMFSAISDFINDSFSEDGGGQLTTAEMGESTLMAVHAPDCSLVIEVRGVPPGSLRGTLLEKLEHMEGEFPGVLSDGQASTLAVEDAMRPLLAVSEAAEPPKKGFPWSWLLLAIMLGVIAWAVYLRFDKDKQFSHFARSVEATPGYVLIESGRDGKQWNLRGLKDPIAPPLPALTQKQLDAGVNVQGDFRPYQSLDESIVLQRATARLAPPAAVSLSLSNGTLTAMGEADAAWLAQAPGKVQTLSGVDALDVSAVRNVDAANREAQLALLAQLKADAGKARVYFEGATTPDANAGTVVNGLAKSLGQIETLTRELGVGMRVEIIGDADPSGSLRRNQALIAQRAQWLFAALVIEGVNEDLLSVGASQPDAGGEVDPQRRRAFVRVLTTGDAR